jgi:hypothetical protein
MKHLIRLLVAGSALAAVGLLALAVCTSSYSFAEPAIRVGAGALKSLENSITAYQDGALEVAVETLSDALQGNLPKQSLP